MKCQTTSVKLFAVLLFAAIAFGLSGFGASDAGCATLTDSYSAASQISQPASETYVINSTANRPPSKIMIYLFQLMFILFFISPPIIALLLFLIWKELKKRNDLK